MDFVESTPRYLLIAAVCIAATQVGLTHFQHETEVHVARGAKCDVTELPIQLGAWTGTNTEIDPRMSAHIGGLSVVERSYSNHRNEQALVHLASFSVVTPDPPHAPEECYPGAGWKILQNEWWHYGKNRSFRWMLVERDGAKAGVAYWYQSGEQVTSNRRELRALMQKLRWQGEAFPPLVKVMVQVPVESSVVAARTVAEELGTDIFEWVRDHSNSATTGG